MISLLDKQWVQFLGIGLLAFCFLGAFYVVDTLPQKQLLDSLKQHKIGLQQSVNEKQERLLALKQDMAKTDQGKSSLTQLLQLMPETTDASGFLEDISQKVLEIGLELDSFRMMAEQDKGFYREIPIDLSVVGNYQELAALMPHLSQLSRMITIHDFSITPIPAKMLSHYRPREDKVLIMRVVLKAYQYVGFEKALDIPSNG